MTAPPDDLSKVTICGQIRFISRKNNTAPVGKPD
jgi:hypothetical protein